MKKNRDVTLYNVLFPLWMILLFPQMWLIVLPGNFLVDSLVLLISLAVLGIPAKKQWYKHCILKIFGFGLLADVIGAGYMLLMLIVFDVGSSGSELLLSLPALVISGVLIFVLNYFFTFDIVGTRILDKSLRLKMSLIFAVVTAPYTFLIPASWLY